MRRVLIYLIVAMTFAGPALAETILLKDGSRMTGTIVGADADSVRFQTPDGVLTIRRERIQSIDYGAETTVPRPVSPPAASPPAATPPPQTVPVETTAPADANSKSFQFILEPGYRFATSEAEGGFSGNVAAMSRITPTVSLGGSVGLAHFNNKVKFLSKGNVTVIPIMAKAVLRTKDGLSFEAGLGYAFTTHNIDPVVETAFALLGYGVEENVDPAILAEAGFGYTSAPQASVSGGIFFGYQIHDPNANGVVTDLTTGGTVTVEGDVSLSAPFVRAFFSF